MCTNGIVRLMVGKVIYTDGITHIIRLPVLTNLVDFLKFVFYTYGTFFFLGYSTHYDSGLQPVGREKSFFFKIKKINFKKL